MGEYYIYHNNGYYGIYVYGINLGGFIIKIFGRLDMQDIPWDSLASINTLWGIHITQEFSWAENQKP